MIRATEVLHDAAVLELMPTAVYVIDSKGFIRAFNSKACEFWGRTPKLLSHDNIWCGAYKLFMPSGEEMVPYGFPMMAAVENGTPTTNAEVIFQMPDGTRIWVLVNIKAIWDQEGKIVGAINAFQDITEQVESRKNLLKQQVLEKTLATLDTFISICSHELKTPLTSLKLQTQLALVTLNKDDETVLNKTLLKVSLDHISGQLDRLTMLVNDMLDVTRIQSGKFSMKFQDVELVSTIKNVIKDLSGPTQGTPALFTITASEEVYASLDAHRIEQVITNLVTNAIKYGEGNPVEVDVKKTQDMVRLQFRDKGKGIELKDQKIIFERFERTDVTDDYSGLGLGLYVTKQIVDAHRGRIYVESEIGIGSNFIVELPLSGRSSPKCDVQEKNSAA